MRKLLIILSMIIGGVIGYFASPKILEITGITKPAGLFDSAKKMVGFSYNVDIPVSWQIAISVVGAVLGYLIYLVFSKIAR